MNVKTEEETPPMRNLPPKHFQAVNDIYELEDGGS